MPDTSDTADPEETEPAQEQEDVRARFREALERKQARTRSGEKHADARSKVHDAHGPVGSKRQFRRKSG